MWQITCVAAFVTLCVRIAPIFIPRIAEINHYPRVMRFLDYTICLITGEIIYAVAFGEMTFSRVYLFPLLTSLFVLLLTGIMMWKTMSMGKSFAVGIFIFIIFYALS